ncbi:CTP synthase [Bacillus pseudomycoides]|uniref:CTP synthase n=1 Tax=Bacillus pseudomycoides TaxID=64104 RepID=A0AA91VD94_9BACI|nr:MULTISPECIES: PRK06770 family protein [Bacillus]PEB55444.1 CTP synthase [Bacillus sp. AFS098217]PED82503.1 CTP synthase [Bacillus pseudomycoides]PEU09910.1 CTP synthase [Bacillus sp. AFS014408]PEU10093.1 CTP synthase [Bacillus sp. AFS019443]PFW60071.1 CTP synthase [Bacillus sp. AFS075034]
MKTLLKILGVIAGMAVIGVAITYGLLYYMNHSKPTAKKVPTAAPAVEVLADSKVKAENAKLLENGNYSLPNSDFNKNFKWTDEKVQIALHEMAHQKVKADQKWGYIFITQERIENLLEIVKSNDLSHTNTYVDILERWKQGKYEKVDKDHNTIWKLQSGNLGEGKGVMSQAEQKELVDKLFMQKETFSGSTLIASGEQVKK